MLMSAVFLSVLFGYGDPQIVTEHVAKPPPTLIRESGRDFEQSQKARQIALQRAQARDYRAALQQMSIASAKRPTHPGLLAHVVRLALATGEIAVAKTASDQLLTLDVALEEGLLEALSSQLGRPEAEALTARQAAVLQPQGAAARFTVIPAAHQLVEGLFQDPSSGHLLASTVVSQTILIRREDDTWATLVDGAAAGASSLFSIAGSRDHLVASFANAAQTPQPLTDPLTMTGLLYFNLNSGATRIDTNIPGQMAGDMLMINRSAESRGGLFVSSGNQVYWKAGPNGFEPLAPQATFVSPQGIVALDARTLLVADYGRGLWRIDRVSGQAQLLAWPSDTTLLGLDSLVLHKGALYSVQNGVKPNRVVRLTLTDEGIVQAQTILKAHPDFDEPTGLASTSHGLLLVAASQWRKYGAGGALRDGEQAAPTPILKLLD